MTTAPVDAREIASLSKKTKGFEIETILLLECECHRQRVEPGKTRVTQSVNAETHANKGGVRVYVSFMLETEDGKSLPLRIQARYLIAYKLTHAASLPEKTLFPFVEGAATFHSWPYWREFVQSMTSRMGLPPLTLPLLKSGFLPKAIRGKNPPMTKEKRSRAKKK